MIAGLPGTGLGGLFFILSALAMPVVHLGRLVGRRQRSSSWRFVSRHALIAVGMLVAIEGAGRAIGWIVVAVARHVGDGAASSLGRAVGRTGVEGGLLTMEVAGVPAALFAVGVLGAVLVVLHVLAAFVRPMDAMPASVDVSVESRVPSRA